MQWKRLRRAGRISILLLVVAGLWPGAQAEAQSLQIAVEATPREVTPGGRSLVEITVANPSGSSVSDVTLEALLPASGVFGFGQSSTTGGGSCEGSGTGNTSCDPGETVVWGLGTLAPGQVLTRSFPLRAGNTTPDATVLPVEATARVAGAASATASRELTVRTAPVLALAVDSDAEVAVAGDAITYTLLFSNRGGATAQSLELSLPVPPGLGFVSASGGGVLDVDTVRWSVGPLLPGQSDSRRAVLELPQAVGPGSLLGPVEARLTGIAPGPESVGADLLVRSAAPSPLTLALDVTPDPAEAGELLVTTLVVGNAGEAPLADVVVEARIPDGLSGFGQNRLTDGGDCTVSGTGNTSCDAGERIQWTLGAPLGPGATRRIFVPPFVAGTAGDGLLIPLRVEAAAPGAGQRLARQTVAVRNARELELSLAEEADPASPGDVLAYSLRYGNAGSESVQGLTLEMPLPAGAAALLDATGGASLVGGLLSWDLGTLLPGQSGSQRVRIALEGGLTPGGILRVGDARIVGGGFTPETARAAAATPVGMPGPLALVLERHPDPVMPDETLHTALTATNRGAGPLFDVVVELLLPDDLRSFGQNFTSDAGDCTISGTGNTSCDSGERVQWQLGTLAPGTGRTLTLPPRLGSGAPDGSLVTLWARAEDAAGMMRARRASAAVDSGRPLDLAVDDDADPVGPGGRLSYVLSFGNASASALPDAMLTLPLPQGVTFVSAEGGGAFVDGDEPRVEWALGPLAAGQVGERLVRVDVSAAAGEILDPPDARLVSSSFPDASRAQVATRVEVEDPLALALDLAPSPVAPGETVQATFSVANRGEAPLFDVVVEARIPEGVSSFNQNLSTGGGTCTVSGTTNTSCDRRERLQWTIAEGLEPGEGRSFTVPLEILSGAASGAVTTLRAAAWHSLGGPQLAQGSTVVQSDRRLELAIDDLTDPTDAGFLRYRLTVANRGPETAGDVLLRLPLQTGAGSVRAPLQGTLVDGGLEWELGAIPPGHSVVRDLVLEPEPGAASGSLVQALGASVVDRADPTRVAHAREATRLVASAPLGLFLSSSVPSTSAGEPLPLAVVAHNRTPAALFDVEIEVRVPEEVQGFSQGTTTGGDCTVSGTTNTSCDAGERVKFTLGTLAAGSSARVELEPVIQNLVEDGRLVSVAAVAREGAGGRAIDTVTIPVPEPAPWAGGLGALAVLLGLARRRGASPQGLPR